MITAVYLYGAWHTKWVFSPWWLAACVILDVYWISSFYGMVSGGDVDPFININIKK